ncbi:hypothetical protein [Pedobacter arcticus]|uniref:hypothetical protein n=1 Tax=Pedobacter arcticus TaxID=752140 RepID=UPI0002FA5493|nr:hypothetical protein [Pedobacter arcticus]
MTLGFSQQINGKPNYFIDKIWEGLLNDPISLDYTNYLEAYKNKFGKHWDRKFHENGDQKGDLVNIAPKLHTIRAGHRWHVGMLIHPVIGNRTKNRFQFAPVIPCVSQQRIFMTYDWRFEVSIGDKYLYKPDLEILAVNDGFENREAFEDYFIKAMGREKKFSGQIIHWTDLRY